MFDLDDLLVQLRDGRMASFRQFIDQADGPIAHAPAGVQHIHSEVYVLVQAGDPTPFKAFRRNEYVCTAARFGWLSPTDAPLERMLAEQVCITQEVREVALWLRRRGCLVMTMSDKPDEATLPTPELAAQGYQPLHRLQTTAVGKSIARTSGVVAPGVTSCGPAASLLVARIGRGDTMNRESGRSTGPGESR